MHPTDVRRILKKIGLRTSRRLGQRFLVDAGVADRQVAAGEISRDDVVLEIGPGLGVLTEKLLPRAKVVYGIEKDRLICDYLKQNFPHLKVICEDATKADFPPFNKIVSNIPFQISSPITFKLMNQDFDLGILMYQKEFAERLVAGQGGEAYSRISVFMYYKAHCELLEVVPKSSFYPVPEVDAAIVRLRPRSPPFELLDEELYFNLVRIIFAHRRKKISNCLSLQWHEIFPSKQQMLAFVRRMAHREERAEELSPEEMAELANSIVEAVKMS